MTNRIKRYTIGWLLISILSFVAGCSGMDMYTHRAEAKEATTSRMVFIESAGNGFAIYKDTVAGVYYLLYTDREESDSWNSVKGIGKSAAMCVLTGQDGKPVVD